MAKLLEVQDLRTQFHTPSGTVHAVDGMSYDVEQGETVAIVGESGCGKSVSALSILRLLPVPSGRIVSGAIRFLGQDLLALGNEDMRAVRGRQIAMVFQEPMTSLNPVLTIGLQLTETMVQHLALSRAESAIRAVAYLQMVGIPEPEQRLKQYPHHLSGGMRQRVMIAMALCCEPTLIIADEPTTALDVTIQAQILELMKGLSQRLGVALILITHNLGVVARYADRVNVMYAGKIIEQGKARDVYRHPRHPYTLGLLRSVPRLDQPRRRQLESIPGMPPDLTRLPNGCAFVPRCGFKVERCALEVPHLVHLENGHGSACWQQNQLGEPQGVA
jgi:oligopeptide/dipeptide ABC transporter ATP-binding protein